MEKLMKEKILGTWTKDEHWDVILNNLQKVFAFTEKEETQLRENVVCELISATAFISRCRTPYRVVISHLTTIIADMKGSYIFDHFPGESLSERLEVLSFFPGGDEDVISAGMLLLEYLSLNHHRATFEKDLSEGIYNPLIDNMNYDEQKRRVMDAYLNLPLSVREKFQPLYEKVESAVYWTIEL